MAVNDTFFVARRLAHLNLHVNDINASAALYRNVMGLGLAWRRGPMRTGFLNNWNTHHDVGLIDVHGPLGSSNEPSLNDLAFKLETQTDLVVVIAGLSPLESVLRRRSRNFAFSRFIGRSLAQFAVNA